jgi:DNA-binding MarR family transcriptional regulator
MTTPAEEEGSGELDDIVSMLLTASRTLVAIAASSLEEVEDMLTLSEFRALVVLQAQGPCGASVLARRLGVSAETGKRVAGRLSADDFVRSDGGGVLQLTGSGDLLVAQVTRRRRIALREIVEKMEPAERGLLVDALIAFARGAGEPLAVEAVSD